MNSRRAWAIVALVAAAALLVVLGYLVVADAGRMLLGVVLLAIAAAGAAIALSHGGPLRVAALVTAGVSFVAAVVVLLVLGHPVEDVVVIALAALAVVATRRALRPNVHLPRAPRPQRAAMIWNAKSGGGKAVEHDLPGEARKRGIEPVELTDGTDLVALAHRLVDDGADGLAAAGGDGTQAIVAAVAAERDVPFACIPAGTRNHFALDLGVDRADVVGALDAFVDGGERPVDLADANGRTFVNNCSIGVYAEAVQRREYRGAKLRTLLATASEALGSSDAVELDFSWTGPTGDRENGAAVILVSNNVYRLGRGIGSGSRPRLDAGVLGIGVIRAPGGTGPEPGRSLWSTWSATDFSVMSADQVNVGLDGEALTLDAPLRFTIRPRALRVRVARRHPGASPSAVQPDSIHGTLLLLWRLAVGARIEGLQ